MGGDEGASILLCALNELDDASKNRDYEPDSTKDFEEGADTPQPGHRPADLFADFSGLCGYRVRHVSEIRGIGSDMSIGLTLEGLLGLFSPTGDLLRSYVMGRKMKSLATERLREGKMTTFSGSVGTRLGSLEEVGEGVHVDDARAPAGNGDCHLA